MNSTFLRSYADPTALPKDGLPQVAFFGRSNAGKSSLINSLTKTKDLARTSSSPGQTRLINIFDFSGIFHLVDLPGYGFAQGSKKERHALFELIDGYLDNTELLRLAVVILDSRIGATDDDMELITHLENMGIPFFIIANKSDKLSRSELSRTLEEMRAKFGNIPVFPHSAITSAGRSELYDAILQHLKQTS